MGQGDPGGQHQGGLTRSSDPIFRNTRSANRRALTVREVGLIRGLVGGESVPVLGKGEARRQAREDWLSADNPRLQSQS